MRFRRADEMYLYAENEEFDNIYGIFEVGEIQLLVSLLLLKV